MRKVVCIGILLLMAGGAQAQSNRLFRAAGTFPLSGSKGDYVPAVAVGDIGAPTGNGKPDGFPDVVTLNRNQASVPVLFGRGDGTFTAGPVTNLGFIPAALALADFNGDQALDLLVADSLSDNVFLLRGFPDGPPFATPGKPIPSGPSPVAVVPAHLNADTHLDAVVVNSGQLSSGITILLGNGDGTFSHPMGACCSGADATRCQTPPAACTTDAGCTDPGFPICVGRLIPAGTGSAAAVVDRFDGDAHSDVAVANADSNDVTIFLGDGAGGLTFMQTVAVGEEPVAIVAADLNGDGHVDLVTANRSADTVSILNGVGNGSFGAARSFASGSSGSSPVSVTVADVNLDGDLDVLVANRQTADVGVLLGDGAGNLASPRTFLADEETEVVAAGDFNRDGADDALTVNQGSGVSPPDVAVLLSRVDGSLSAIENVITQPNPLAVTAGDVDDDGVCDLIVGHSGSPDGNVLVFRAMAEGGFAAPDVLKSEGDVVAVSRGDFNRDGLLDVVALNHSDNGLSVFLAGAGGSFALAHNYQVGGAATSALVVGDWNRDGRDDLAITLQGTDSGVVKVLLANTDGTFGTPTSLTTGKAPVGIDYGDFDRDGRLDLAVVNSVSNDVWVYLGDGAGGFHALRAVPGSGGLLALAVADFDRDGSDDIAVAQQATSSITVLYGDGKGGFNPGQPVGVGGGFAAAMTARDLNGDLVPDLFVADQSGSNVVVALIGSGTGFQRESYAVSRGPWSTTVADLDGDGRYDGAVANRFVATASVLTNVEATPVLRGDGNADGRRSAADIVAVWRELSDNPTARVELAPRGAYPAGLGVDANGDGLVTSQDAAATAHRLFQGS
jgi:hypothetical protein